MSKLTAERGGFGLLEELGYAPVNRYLPPRVPPAVATAPSVLEAGMRGEGALSRLIRLSPASPCAVTQLDAYFAIRMKPAFSVLFFTVLSGAGLGALALLGALDLLAAFGALSPPLPPRLMPGALAVALAFVVSGLSSSTLHLANPKNAWRSATRWRTSWLSREAIISLVLILVASCYALACWLVAAPACAYFWHCARYSQRGERCIARR